MDICSFCGVLSDLGDVEGIVTEVGKWEPFGVEANKGEVQNERGLRSHEQILKYMLRKGGYASYTICMPSDYLADRKSVV